MQQGLPAQWKWELSAVTTIAWMRRRSEAIFAFVFAFALALALALAVEIVVLLLGSGGRLDFVSVVMATWCLNPSGPVVPVAKAPVSSPPYSQLEQIADHCEAAGTRRRRRDKEPTIIDDIPRIDWPHL